MRVLESKKDFTLDSLIAAAYDSYLTWFEKPMPALIKAWDATARFESAEGENGGADRGAAQVGSAMGGGFDADFARGFLGRGNAAEPGRREERRRRRVALRKTSAIESAPADSCLQR